MLDSLTNELKIVNQNITEYSQDLKDHEKFDLHQTWYCYKKIP